jgi:hypothetical protein
MPNKTYDSIDDAKKEATSQTNKTGRIHFINFAEGTTDKYVVIPSELGVGTVAPKKKGGKIRKQSGRNRLY